MASRSRNRASGIGGLIALATVALVLAGCGSESRENRPRPPIPAGVSVNVTGKQITLSPSRVAFGPQTRQQVIENGPNDEIEGDPDLPMPVSFTISNTTDRDVRLALLGPARRVSRPVTPAGTGALSAELPTGAYRVRILGDGGAREARLLVGRTRVSPQNDLLLP